MIILHVEDKTSWFEEYVRPRLKTRDEIYHAITKESAVIILQGNKIDYVILDLAIPLDDVNSAPSVMHGVALAVFIRNNYPGIPILILTGQSTEDAAQELEDDDSFTNFWDGKVKNLVKTRKKRDLDLALDLVNEACVLLDQLDGFEIQFLDQKARELTVVDKRIIKLFGKCNDAIGAQVSVLTGGLSDSKVLAVNLVDQHGHSNRHAIAKIDSAIQIESESSNYNSQVTKLPVGAFPVELGQYYAGCGNRKGIFYQLASEYKLNYFDVLIDSDELTVELIGKLKEQLIPWHSGRNQRVTSIKVIRRLLCPDKKFRVVYQEHLKDIDIEKFEDQEINANWSVQHGDLHGANILVSDDNRPILIDYGDINNLPCSLDPITLEMSPFFHPSLSDDFQVPDGLAENWFNEKYFELVKSPIASREIRDWVNENAHLDREIYAVMYSYCMRQLTYNDTDKNLAVTFIRMLLDRFE